MAEDVTMTKSVSVSLIIIIFCLSGVILILQNFLMHSFQCLIRFYYTYYFSIVWILCVAGKQAFLLHLGIKMLELICTQRKLV